MANANVKEFTDSNFDSEVLGASQPVLVDFWAEWCQPCKMLGPVIDQLAAELGEKAKIGKVDIDNNRSTAMKYGVTAIPTVIIFKGGQVMKKYVGFQKKDTLAAALQEAGA
jgi:thioredoxin 1